MQKLLIAAKQKQYADSLNVVYRSDIAILSEQVRTHRIKDSLQAQISATWQAMVNTQQQQRDALEGQVKSLMDDLRRQKRKTTWTGIGGVALTAITTVLFLFK